MTDEPRSESTPAETATSTSTSSVAKDTSITKSTTGSATGKLRRAATRGFRGAILVGVGVAIGSFGQPAAVAPVVEDDDYADEAPVVIWTCAMHPQIRMTQAGQCPICGMDLVPAAESGADHNEPTGRVALSLQATKLAQIQTTEVTRSEPRVEVRLLGRVDYDETRLRSVTSWTAGRIDRLRVRVTGTRIRQGQVIATLYSPEIYAAMRDLQVAKKQARKLSSGLHNAPAFASATLDASKERLRLLGVPDDTIDTIENKSKAPTHVDIRSSSSGTVLKRLVEEGDYVSAGSALYHVADLSKVWVQIDAYESDLPHLRVGQEVVVDVTSFPGEPMLGKVAFIDPVIDPRLRTARVRVEVPNRDGRLRPGMFAEALIEVNADAQHGQITIPASAALFTGRRSVVYVDAPGKPGQEFELREVRLGPRAGPVYPVLAGLSEGERVVSQGAFVLDADLQLSGGRSMMVRGDDTGDGEHMVKVPAEFRETIKPVVEDYLSAQLALAGDDFGAARETLSALAATINEIDPPGPRDAREAWQEIASSLGGHARLAAASQDDGRLRGAFEHVSAQIERILRVLGNPLDKAVRVVFCPMAFDSKGAAWVQDSDTVHNPYYGKAMLRCGDIRATVLPGERLASAPDSPAALPAAAAGGHQH